MQVRVQSPGQRMLWICQLSFKQFSSLMLAGVLRGGLTAMLASGTTAPSSPKRATKTLFALPESPRRFDTLLRNRKRAENSSKMSFNLQSLTTSPYDTRRNARLASVTRCSFNSLPCRISDGCWSFSRWRVESTLRGDLSQILVVTPLNILSPPGGPSSSWGVVMYHAIGMSGRRMHTASPI
eukprot:scaffold84545_cov30-Tisochrysis_lutea.AAC.3